MSEEPEHEPHPVSLLLAVGGIGVGFLGTLALVILSVEFYGPVVVEAFMEFVPIRYEIAASLLLSITGWTSAGLGYAIEHVRWSRHE